MTLTMEANMPRKSTTPPELDEPIGPILKANLIRLGFAETTVKVKTVADLIAKKTGRPMSRQRISNLLNAVKVHPKTIETLAKGLGVKTEELTRKPKGGKAP